MYVACDIIHYFKHSLIQNTYLMILYVDPSATQCSGITHFHYIIYLMDKYIRFFISFIICKMREMTYLIVLFCVNVSTAPCSSRQQDRCFVISGRYVLQRMGEAVANSSLGFLRNGIWKSERTEKRDLKNAINKRKTLSEINSKIISLSCSWRERPVSPG